MAGSGRASVEIKEEPLSALHELSAIPIRFTVSSVFDVVLDDADARDIRLTERQLGQPYEKDYDALAGEGPTRWAGRFDVSNWGLLTASANRQRIGSMVIAWRTPGVALLEGRDDLAVLWDLRILPAWRGKGIGSLLFERAEQWAAERGCTQLKVETQNTNVPACRFYARQGCTLTSAHLHAYPTLPDEVQLLWYKSLRNE